MTTTNPEQVSARDVIRAVTGGLQMYTSFHDKNMCNDRWLAGLVDAMDEAESLRADDFCRSADVPAGLLAQLQNRPANVRQPAAMIFEFA